MTGTNGTTGSATYRPGIKGIESVLCGAPGFVFYPHEGLKIVMHGPAGAGKTLLALQMAVGGLMDGRNVIYLSKDTSEVSLVTRIWEEFNLFGHCGGLATGPCPLGQPFDVAPRSETDTSESVPAEVLERMSTACTFAVPPAGQIKDTKHDVACRLSGARFVLLDRLAEVLQDGHLTKEEHAEQVLSKALTGASPIMAVGGFGLLDAGSLDRYANHRTVFEGLAHLCPKLRQVFDWLGQTSRDKESASYAFKTVEWTPGNMMVIYDSLPSAVLEESLRVQSEGPVTMSVAMPPGWPIALYVLESREMQGEMVTAFPPDVQIKLDMCDGAYGKRSRTVQVLKARFQAINGEPHPFVILDRTTCSRVGTSEIVDLEFIAKAPADSSLVEAEKGERSSALERRAFVVRTPGITVLPSMMTVAEGDAPRAEPPSPRIGFGRDSIDNLTREGGLSGGKCTLVVTENRCHSAALGLHFLLGQIGRAAAELRVGLREPLPHSVLYVALDDDLVGVLHGIWRHRMLRAAVFGDSPEQDAWQTIERRIRRIPSTTEQGMNHLYKVPLRHLVPYTLSTDDLLLDAQHLSGFTVDHEALSLAFGKRVGPSIAEVIQRLQKRALKPDGQGYEPPAIEDRCRLVSLLNDFVLCTTPALGAVVGTGCSPSAKRDVLKRALAPLIAECGPPEKCLLTTYRPYLYILIPDMVWSGPEEVLESMRAILHESDHAHPHLPDTHCAECLRIDRVLLNRISRIPSRWPLISDPTLFVFSMARLCSSRSAELMLIDDTAEQSHTTGHISSKWQSVARNIIRLRRIPLRGSEAVGLQVVRTGGTTLKLSRPVELRETHISLQSTAGPEPDSPDLALDVFDTFRGYTGVFTGNPERCKIIVDLTYDRENTPLHADVANMARNLRTLMESVRVNELGPEKRSGINSALANLAFVSHDACRVVSVDEVWLHRLLSESEAAAGLVPFSPGDLLEILPEHVKKGIGGHLLSSESIAREYVTQAFTIAARKSGRQEAAVCAIPYRHNWGVLAVAKVRREALDDLYRSVEQYLQHAVLSLPSHANGSATDAPSSLAAMGSRVELLFAVMHESDEMMERLKKDGEKSSIPKSVKRIATRFRKFLWKEGHSALSWQDILQFKNQIWDSAFRDMGEFWETVTEPDLRAKTEATFDCRRIRKWFTKDDRFEFFDFDRATSESRVCFLLELLLANLAVDEVFDRAPPNDECYVFATEDMDRRRRLGEGLGRSLILMHNLLSLQQRRGLARVAKPQADDHGQAGRSWALLSREWLSTVPRVHSREDIRQAIELRHLPAAGGRSPNMLLRAMLYGSPHGLARLSKDELKRLARLSRGKGVTTAGTWYLGTMSGGNRELATDIIRELVSEYHEADRFLSAGSPPVSKKFYTESRSGEMQMELPYAEVIRDLVSGGPTSSGAAGGSTPGSEGQQDRTIEERAAQPGLTDAFLNSDLVFPFCRTRIRGYTRVSLVLLSLIRRVMEISPERDLADSDKKLGRLVDEALAQIDQIEKEFRKQG